MLDCTDNELMAAYSDGCQESFEELFLRYERRAYAFFLRRVRSEERARDLYQELFLRLHRFRDTYDPEQPFAPWFFRIARNALIDETRRFLRCREVLVDEVPEPAREPEAERRVAAREEVARVLSELPDDQVRVLVETRLLGREYRELGPGLGKSLDAVKQMASRSLRKLRLARVGTD